MAIVIKWTDEAKKTFDKNISYLLEEWTEGEIRNFVKQTNYILLRIAAYPEMYSASPKNPKIRKAAINKYIVFILSLQYHKERSNVVDLLA